MLNWQIDAIRMLLRRVAALETRLSVLGGDVNPIASDSAVSVDLKRLAPKVPSPILLSNRSMPCRHRDLHLLPI